MADAYVGLMLGHASADNTVTDRDGFSNTGVPDYTVRYRDDGTSISALAGYVHHVNSWQLGVELDATYSDLSAQSMRIDPVGLDETLYTRSDFVATLQFKLGRQISAAWLAFVNVGYSYSRIENELYDLDFGDIYDPDDSYLGDSGNDGLTLGLGVEYALTEQLRLRADVQHTEFNRQSHYVNRNTFVSRSGVLTGIKKYDTENDIAVFRLGILYHL